MITYKNCLRCNIELNLNSNSHMCICGLHMSFIQNLIELENFQIRWIGDSVFIFDIIKKYDDNNIMITGLKHINKFKIDEINYSISLEKLKMILTFS